MNILRVLDSYLYDIWPGHREQMIFKLFLLVSGGGEWGGKTVLFSLRHLRLENINLSKLAPNSSLSKLDTFVGETPAYILNTIAYCQVLSVRHHFLHVLNVPWPRSDKKKWQSCVTRNNNNRALVFVKRVRHDGWAGAGGGTIPCLHLRSDLIYANKETQLH